MLKKKCNPNNRKKEGNTLFTGMLGSVERFLKRHNYGSSVISNVDFPKTKAALAAKQKELKSLGLGSKPMAATGLSAMDIDKLYETNQMGRTTPESVLQTLWFNNMTHFGMRGNKEHREMMWGDVELNFDNDLNSEYLEFHERATKTRTGVNIRDTRPCPPRMYASPNFPDRCPVELYKLYNDKRPTDYCNPTDPFYIATVTHTKTPGPNQRWFLRGPVGIHKIKEMMKRMAKNAELPEDKRLTNTSVRKTLVQRMTDCNVPDNLQVYVTGHKRPESLNNYRQLGNVHKKQISNLLTHNSAQPQATLCAPTPSSSTNYPPIAAPTQSHIASGSKANCFPLAGPSNSHDSSSTVQLYDPSVSKSNPINISSDGGLVPSQSNVTSSTQLSQQSNTRFSMESIFAGTTINGNVNVNFNNYSSSKRRRIRVIASDSDSSQ